jgi:hypothetical protein
MISISDNGWWPKLSPDGQWVAYGNGVVRLMNLTSGGTRILTTGTQNDGVGAEWCAGWLDHTTVAVMRQMVGNNRQLRFESVTGAITKPAFPTWWAFFTAANNHVMAAVPSMWLSPNPGNNQRFMLDGIDVTPADPTGAITFNGTFYGYFSTESIGYPYVVRDLNGVELIRFPTTTDNRTFSLWFPKIFTDPIGDPWICSSDSVRDVRGHIYPLAPNERNGGCLTWRNGECLVWSAYIADTYTAVGVPFSNTSWVIGRPLADCHNPAAPGIVVEGMWQSDLQVVAGATGWVVAGFNGGGTLGVPAGTTTVTTVPFDTPRTIVPRIVVPPVLPVLLDSQRPVHTSSMDGTALGSVRWGVDIEGGRWAWDLYQAGKPAKMLFHDLRDPLDRQFVDEYGALIYERKGDPSSTPISTTTLQALSGAGIICYHDSNGVYTVMDGETEIYPHITLVQSLRAKGIDAVIGHQGYFHTNLTDTFWYLEEGLKRYTEANIPCAVIRPGYCGNTGTGFPWPLRDIQIINHGETDLINRYPVVRFDCVFGLDRPQPDAAWTRTFFRTRCQLTGPSPWPLPVVRGPVAPVVLPLPPVVVVPTPPPPSWVPRPSHTGRNAAIVSAATGIGVFVTWLIRKLKRKH